MGTPLTGHTAGASITAVAFDPTGAYFASGSRDRTSREKPVVIRDASSLAEFVVFPSLHTGWINDIAFSEDGQTLASASQDGMVILWELDPAAWRKQACDRAGRNLREAERKEYLDGAGADLCSDQPSFRSASTGSPTAASPVPAE
jgi:WD40 repeat protein